MDVGDFIFYYGTEALFCKRCKLKVKANKNGVEIHRRQCSGSAMPQLLDSLKNRLVTPERISSWVHPIVDKEHIGGPVAGGETKLFVCSLCGFPRKHSSEVRNHIKETHLCKVKVIEGKGVTIKRKGTYILSLSDKVLENKIKRMQKTGEPCSVESIEERNLSQETLLKKMLIDSPMELELDRINPFLPPPVKSAKEFWFTKPSNFDLGLWTYGQDVSQDVLKHHHDLVKGPENKTECLIAGATLSILARMPGYICNTPAYTLKLLTTTKIRGRNDYDNDDDEHIANRNFSNVLPQTLEKYSKFGLKIVLGMFLMYYLENHELLQLVSKFFFLGATGEFDMKDWVQLVRQSNFSMDHTPRNLALGLHYRSSSPRNKMYPVRTGILNIKM